MKCERRSPPPGRSGRGKHRADAARRAAHLRALRATVPVLLVALWSGCASPKLQPGPRAFNFSRDTFAYPNQLSWVYHFDAEGKWVHHPREPEPDYAHHCFVVVRCAKQFFQNARFDPGRPVADEATYRKLIRQVVSVDPDHVLPEEERVVIPGYADLRSFSRARESLLKAEGGGAWRSYFQRGNWRMIFPFGRGHQQETAERLAAEVKANRPPIVHLVRFPQLTINHAVLLFAASESDEIVTFTIYDPNEPAYPRTLIYNRASRTFVLPMTNYFPGGRVDVYEVYRSWLY